MRNTSYLIAHWFWKMALPFSVVQKMERKFLSSYEPFVFNWKGQRKNHLLGFLPGFHSYFKCTSFLTWHKRIQRCSHFFDSWQLSFSFSFVISHTNTSISWLTYICGLIPITAPSIPLLQLQTQSRSAKRSLCLSHIWRPILWYEIIPDKELLSQF